MEPINLGAFNFATLWKAIAIVVALAMMLTIRRYQLAPPFVVFGLLFSAISLLNPSIAADPIGTIAYAMKYMYLPLAFLVLLGIHRRRRFHSQTLVRWSSHLAIFTALSGLPFIVGVIEPISDGGYDLGLFGIEGFGFTGLFFHSHSASIAMATAAIHLVWNAKQSSRWLHKIIFLHLVALALYCLFATFARTGYALAIVGICIVAFVPFKPIKALIYAPLFLIGLLVVGSVLLDNNVIRMRLLGENIHTIASGVESDLGSGRLRFWNAASEIFQESTFLEKFLGIGPYFAQEAMQEKVNLRISAHNDFFNALMFSGALGFSVFIGYTLLLLRMAWTARFEPALGALVLSLTGSYLVQMILQGERVLISELMLVMVLFAAKVRTECETVKLTR